MDADSIIVTEKVNINGVKIHRLSKFTDNRGSFSELFRSQWAPHCNYTEQIQLNLSRSVMGALRGLHYHHRQYDWWVPVNGSLQTALIDLRSSSDTFMKTSVFRVSAEDSLCLLIPPGVAHGFLALSEVTLLYAVDRYYDGTDEQGVAWNDNTLEIPWTAENPIVSARDMNNPTIEELKRGKLLPS